MSRRGSAESLDYGFGDDAPRGEGVAEAPTPPAPAVVVPTITVMTEESLERRRRASEVAQATGGGPDAATVRCPRRAAWTCADPSPHPRRFCWSDPGSGREAWET